MTFSTFTAYFAANKNNVPASVAAAVRREAVARVQERMSAGRADSVLDFSDLVLRMENAVAA